MHNIQKAISWNGVFIGVIVSLAIVSLFNLLGVGLGMARLTGPTTMNASINIGFIIWIILSSMIPILCGSWLAAVFSNLTSKFDAIVHSIVIWGLATIISLLFVTSTTGMLFNNTASWLNETVTMQHQQETQKTPIQQTVQAATEKSLANFEKETAGQSNVTENTPHVSPQQFSEVIKNITILTFLGFVVSAVASIIGGIYGVRRNIEGV